MSETLYTQIRSHKVWDEMRQLGPILDQAKSIEPLSEEWFDGFRRIEAILTLCGTRLAAANPLLVFESLADEMAQGFAGAREQLSALIEDRVFAIRLQAANTSANRALAAVVQVPVLIANPELEQFITTASEHRSLSEKSLENLRRNAAEMNADISDLRTRAAEVSQSLQAEQVNLTTVIGEYQRQFSEAQEKRNTDFAEILRQAQQAVSTVIAEYQSQHSSAQDARSREFSETQGNRQEKFNGLINEYGQLLNQEHAAFQKEGQRQLTEFQVDYSNKATKILEAIEEDKRRIENLVGVIGNLGVTSGYLNVANLAKKSVWCWQAITVIAMIVLSIVAGHTLNDLEDKNGHFLWGAFAARAFMLASLGAIAAYAGSQADKFFEVERRNRKLALELEAIGPYLAPLPEDEQNKFRIQIGDRSFGREDERHDARHTSPVNLLHLLRSKHGKEILDFIVDYMHKQKPEQG